ncbi:RHS repeat-associated core domain-containing protein [Oscillospiraceae bacterium MB08-C2-2]|nr:RHS repeat-associated core domain-containing protein [Oscillospiraceae bacterium MB08-C2-2]
MNNKYKADSINKLAAQAVSSDTEGDVTPLKNYPDAPFSYSSAENESASMGTGAFQLTATDFILPGKNGLDLVMTRQYNSSNAALHNLVSREVTGKERRYGYVIYKYAVRKNIKTGGTIETNNVPLWGECDFQDRDQRTAARAKAMDEYKDEVIKSIIQDDEEITETLKYKDTQVEYYIRHTETEENNYFVDAYGLGHGWSFAFPSIEQIAEVKSNGKDVENRPYLHLADGRTLRLKDTPTSTSGSNLVDYSLGDVRIQQTGGTISHAGSQASYEYILSYKNGQKDYLSSSTIVARQDRFGNTILFRFTKDSGAEMVDSLGRTVRLTRTNTSSGYTLTWELPDTGKIIYTISKAEEGVRLSQVRDQENQLTSYDYAINDTFQQINKNISGDTNKKVSYLNLKEIVHPTGLQSTYKYSTVTQEEEYWEFDVEDPPKELSSQEKRNWSGKRFGEYSYGRQRQYNVLQWRQDHDGTQALNRQDYTFTGGVYEKRSRRVFLHYMSKATIQEEKSGIPVVRTFLFNEKSMLQSITEVHNNVAMQEDFFDYDNDKNKQRTQQITKRYNAVTASPRPILQAQTNWTYDPKGNVKTQTLPLQGTTTFDYDAAYSLLTEKLWYKDASTQIRENYSLRSDQKLVEWKKVYEQKNGVETLKEATQYQYDANNNLSSERHYANLNLTPSPYDAVISYSYSNTNPQLDSNIYSGVYLTEKRIIGLRDANGAVLPDVVEKYSRDAHGRALRVTDPSGRVTNYTYDRLGRVIREVYPDQSHKETQYVVSESQNWIMVSEKDTSGKLLRQNRLEYTPLGKIQRTYALNPETCLTYHTYDARNRLVREYAYSTEGTTATAYTYDAFDRILSKTTTGPGITPYEERYSYDDAFDPAQGLRKDTKEVIGDANSPTVISTVLRDVLERVREEAVGAAVTRYAYNQAGNRISQTDPLGNITLWAYDYAGRMETETRTTESGSVTAVTSYNPLGHKQNFRDFRGNSTTFLHDAAGRLLEQSVDLNGSERMITRYAYNPSGEVTSQKSLANNGVWRETGYTYDSRSRVVDTILYDGKAETRTRFEYDALGNKAAVYTGMLGSSIAGAAKTTYTYDRFGSVQTMTDPIGNSPSPSSPERRTEFYSYDAYGKLRTKQDRNGDLTTYTYDGLGRVLSERAADSEKKQADAFRLYVYTKTGQTAMEENSQLRIRYAYDSMGRLLSQTEVCLSSSASTVTKNYTYDLYGNRKSFILRKDGVTELSLAYDYDRQNRLTVLKKDGHSLATYAYDENGNRKSLVYPQSGITTEYVYNAANLVTGLTNKKSGAHCSSYHYSYFPDGNQARKLSKGSGRADRITDYLYDGLGRLTEEKEQDGRRILYQYDRFSNRSRMTVTDASGKNTVTSYAYDLRNRLETETKTDHKGAREIFHYRYDYNGNQLYREWERLTPQGDAEKKQPGRVGFYSNKFGQDVVILEKRGYNGFNQLVSLYRDTLVTSYAYRPDGLRHKKSFADGTSHTHIWDGQNMVAEYGESGRIFARYLRGINLIAREQDGLCQYYLFNAHGDAVERTDQSGTTLKNYDYDAFGVEKSPEKLDGNPFRYCGEYFDREAGTVYLRARNYEPVTGRFISEDPIMWGLNWYAYCGGNPILYIDPLGLKSYIFYDPFGDDADNEIDKNPNALSYETAQAFQRMLAKRYGISKKDMDSEIVLYALKDYNDFKDYWNNTMESDPDAIIFNAHANPDLIQLTRKLRGKGPMHHININDVDIDLDVKTIEALYLLGCEPGAPGNGGNNNIAQAFWDKMNITTMFAADAGVGFNRERSWFNKNITGVTINVSSTSSNSSYTPQGMLMWNSTSSGVPVPLKDPFKPTFAQLANLTK